MYEYNCKIVRVIDGDSIIKMLTLIWVGLLGVAVSAYVFMVLILQSAAHEMQKRKLPDSWRRSLSRTRCTSEKHTP
jgi:hypothetical protein